jgi:predicted membrane protein
LTGLGLPPGATTVRVEVGAGNLEVVVPDDVDLDITAAVGIGNIDVEVDGQNLNDAGFGAEISQIARAPGANSALKLEFDVSFGNILVEDLQPR